MGGDLGRPLERLRVDGGLTRSASLMQAQADLLQAPVELYPSPDATALGVAAFARLGSGAAASPEEAVGQWSPVAVFEPRMSADEAAERLGRWERAATALAELGSAVRMSDDPFDRDAVIVGGGVVGTAIARELSRFEHRCTLLEAGPDVGAGTSKANTALLHTGFDSKPGTLESRLVQRGYELLSEYAPSAGIPLELTGALLVAWNAAEEAELDGIVERSQANGYGAIRRLGLEELRELEPHLGRGAPGALEVPDEGIICPFTTTLAYATEAVANGCELRLERPLTGVERLTGGGFRVHTRSGDS